MRCAATRSAITSSGEDACRARKSDSAKNVEASAKRAEENAKRRGKGDSAANLRKRLAAAEAEAATTIDDLRSRLEAAEQALYHCEYLTRLRERNDLKQELQYASHRAEMERNRLQMYLAEAEKSEGLLDKVKGVFSNG